MELAQVLKAIQETPKGANIVVEWERPCKTYKGVPHVVSKRVRMVGRIGIEYDNQQNVIAGRAEGSLPAENQGLKGMEWVIYPWLLQTTKTGKHLLRLYKGTSDKIHPSVSFFLDGQEVSRESVDHFLTSEERKSPADNACFSCGVENILRLHKEEVQEEALEEA